MLRGSSSARRCKSGIDAGTGIGVAMQRCLVSTRSTSRGWREKGAGCSCEGTGGPTGSISISTERVTYFGQFHGLVSGDSVGQDRRDALAVAPGTAQLGPDPDAAVEPVRLPGQELHTRQGAALLPSANAANPAWEWSWPEIAQRKRRALGRGAGGTGQPDPPRTAGARRSRCRFRCAAEPCACRSSPPRGASPSPGRPAGPRA